MGIVERILLCIWHVNKNWLEKLNKIKNADTRKEVQKYLVHLGQALNIEKFFIKLNDFMSILMTNDKTVELGVGFKSNYCHQPEKWTFAYRKHCGINTNMVLETLN